MCAVYAAKKKVCFRKEAAFFCLTSSRTTEYSSSFDAKQLHAIFTKTTWAKNERERHTKNCACALFLARARTETRGRKNREERAPGKRESEEGENGFGGKQECKNVY